MKANTVVGPTAVWPSRHGPWRDETFGAILCRVAGRYPERDAVVWPAEGGELRSMTYRELLAAATSGARWLLDRARAGARVATWSATSVEGVLAFCATALSGTVVAPIHPNVADAEFAYLLEQSGAAIALASPEHRGSPLAERAAGIVATGGIPATVLDIRIWAAEAIAGRTQEGPSLPKVPTTAPYILQYTSGTTGRPKGALMNHRAKLNSVMLGFTAPPTGEHEVSCTPFPLHHTAGGSLLIGTLAIGGTYVVVPSFEPTLLLDLWERTGATRTGLVPTMAIDVLAVPGVERRDLALRLIWSGGSATAPSLLRRMEEVLGAQVLNGYGQSEAPWITQTLVHDDDDVKAETIGRPLPHRDVQIVEPGTSKAVPLGVVGELCTRGPLVMDGYFGMPAETREVFDAEGWLHTDDLCSMDERGVIRIHGRARDVIIRGGENVYPSEVEHALLQHAGVAEAAVVGAPDERWGEVVVAFVRRAPGAVIALGGLGAFARERLASYKVPRRWVFVDSFPTTASGKIRKIELLAMLDQVAP